MKMDQHPLFTGDTSVTVMTPDEPKYPAKAGGHPSFQAALRDMGLRYEITHGQYEKPERSYIIYGASRGQAQRLGGDFGQEAVLFSEGGKPEIHYTNGPNRGKSHPYQPEGNVMWDKQPNEPYWTHFPGYGYARLGFDWDQLVDPEPRPTRPVFQNAV